MVEAEAWCWGNWHYVDHRPYMGAYLRPAPMEFDVTEAFRPGGTNQITIRVNTGLAPAQGASGLISRIFLHSPMW